MSGNTSRTFPIAGNCGLPSNATAYSLNVTVVPTGGLSYLTIWPAGQTQPVVSTLNDPLSTIVANAAIVPAGQGGSISVYVTDQTHLVIDVNGYFISGINGNTSNTAVGQSALPLANGDQNTAVGYAALTNNSNGNFNTSMGSTSLQYNTSGSGNTAIGEGSMVANTTGSNNTGLGYESMYSAGTTNNNVALGYEAFFGATGSNSVAVGAGTLSVASGNNNIAVGYQAGSAVQNGSNNIDIGSAGTSGDSAVIRVGTPGTQTTFFAAGISGVNVTGGAAVFVNSNGQLGVSSSSRRYKEDIHPMADASDRLMDLEPVTFKYKQSVANGSQDTQYGLIAEQVAAVYPELAVYGKDGQVETLQYQQLPAMLLNEIQKQHKTIADLEARIAALEQLLKTNAAAVNTAGH